MQYKRGYQEVSMIMHGLCTVTTSVALLSGGAIGQQDRELPTEIEWMVLDLLIEPHPMDRATFVIDGRVHTDINPLFDNLDYFKALEELSTLRLYLDSSAPPREKSLVLDEMSRAVLEARRVLWNRRRESPIESVIEVTLHHQGKRLNLPEWDPLLMRRAVRDSFWEKSYRASLGVADLAQNVLNVTTDPARADHLLDEISRSLLAARGALWQKERGKRAGGESDRELPPVTPDPVASDGTRWLAGRRGPIRGSDLPGTAGRRS